MSTIKDVAALAGVSYTTVSHVINKTRPVSDKVRGEVEAAIQRLNYVPSAVARSLKQQSTCTIGLLISNSSNPFFAELAQGIEDICYRAGYTVVLCNSDDQPERQQTYLRVLLEKRIDGLIICSAGDDLGLAEHVREANVPIIIVDRAVKGVTSDIVQIDHFKGGYLATRHLLEQKHKSIGCIAGPDTTTVSTDRLNGYRKALAEAGAPFRPEWVIRGDFTAEGGYKAARILLKRAEITAVFASNDLMGIGLLRFAAEHAIRVPNQLSVIGFDGIDLGRYIYPALTTVGQSIRRQGEIAAGTLLERIRKGGEGRLRKILMTPELTVRESTGTASPFLLSRHE
ncbi:MAG: LacI family DNA-binding transcriptional regulator [Verrucomicrobia bacterium]|nr:LacI family DNA-binding transcriptional regulator [Verrucomicrobiota bacterium]MBV9300403.1 LacI family DNA-binding transcriptional regulator [Verrucomicrobiota bacterium]